MVSVTHVRPSPPVLYHPNWSGHAMRKKKTFSMTRKAWKPPAEFQGKKRPKWSPTLNEQVGRVHSLALDAICSTGIGASVLPTD